MLFKVYFVYNNETCLYEGPFVFRSNGQMTRIVSESPKSELIGNILCVGTFDNETGVLDKFESAERVPLNSKEFETPNVPLSQERLEKLAEGGFVNDRLD